MNTILRLPTGLRAWSALVVTLGLTLGLTLTLLATLLPAPAEAAKPARRPDGYVKLASGTEQWVGIKEYFHVTPFETTSELEIPGAGTYRFRYRVMNRGRLHDSIRVLAARWSTPPADCSYKVVRRGQNITRKVTNTGFVERLQPGDKTTYRVKIGAGEWDDQCSLEFISTSTKNFNRNDHVLITVANTA